MMRSTLNVLPYKSHPLYRLKLNTIISDVAGLLLNIVAIASLASYNSWNIPIFLTSVVFLFISFTFCVHDLVTYAISKAAFPSDITTNPLPTPATFRATTRLSDETPEWPCKRLVITDLVLALIFQWLFWAEFFAIIYNGHRSYYSDGAETFEAYANLTNVIASILHGVAFWKELMARKHAAWKKDLEVRECDNCGHFVKAKDENVANTLPNDVLDCNRVEAGPSQPSILERFGKGEVTMPKWAKWSNVGKFTDDVNRDRESGVMGPSAEVALLATPEDSGTEVGGPSRSRSYGTLGQSVESVESVPETVVKKKEKGKKRLVDV
ncbi:hypothetical protein K505DRAFT_323169, partial [Melanomma pulvis-pyrius CBS 109.77]